ncbi:MAG: D-alanyl-D-alanine carboxypeptidase [Candidatus Accumulibacter sp.]|jgi:D-alanyl-D-alanine carboxypeptidase (penicillin-binding protein 5/6)|nr:D-alanyl-D-alanine carboxypeptidase [Accumulibacter sp.]
MLTCRPFFLIVLLFPLLAGAQPMPTPPALAARTWLLVEAASGQALAAQAIEERVEPASLTKIMTAYLTFAAIQQGKIKLNQTVLVSERAWRMPGSRMFIKVNTQVAVEDLIKGLIVQSGNDASVALAEAIAGSEDNFARTMNQEAQRLGLKNTRFGNASGMPDPQHYTTARDLATLTIALIRDFPNEYAKYYSMKTFRYNNIAQPNRNRLLHLDPTVDGIKTGHTEAAGYCLIASSRRGDRRLLAIVLGAASDSVRTQETLKLLNYGFQSYEAVRLYTKDQPVSNLRVWKGSSPTVKAGFQNDFVIAVPKGFAPRLKTELLSRQPLMAPVAAGQFVGTLKVSLDDKPYADFPAVAIETVSVAGIFGRMIDTIRLWFN